MTEPMTLWTILPVKPYAEAKARLTGALSAAARAALAERLFERTLAVALDYAGGRPVLVVSRCPQVAARAAAAGALALGESGNEGLNAALRQAIGHAHHQGAGLALCVASDLPLLERADLEALEAAAGSGAALAPDRHGRGTNALLQPAGDDPVCAFGPDSYFRHLAALRARGKAATVERRGLALDLDCAADLAALGERRAVLLRGLDVTAPERASLITAATERA